MNRIAFFTDQAKQDLAESRDWYEAEVDGLGYDLVDEVEILALMHGHRDPKAWMKRIEH